MYIRKIERDDAAAARAREASILSARVPSGSESHLSGKRFAAPVRGRLSVPLPLVYFCG